MRAWTVCPKWRMALGAAAKCGSTTISQLTIADRKFPGKRERNGREDWTAVPTRGYRVVGIVRHPVARFWSLFGNIQARFRGAHNLYKQLEGRDPHYVLDTFERDLDYDFHYQPQYRIGLLDSPKTELVRLESLDIWWSVNRPEGAPAMPRANRGEGGLAPADDYLATRIGELYAADLALWERAYAGSTPSTTSARDS